MYKISHKNISYNVGHISIFYNNYKWSTTFKNYDSLYCTSITYIILYATITIKILVKG